MKRVINFPQQYIEVLRRQHQAIESITDGLREYFLADIEHQINVMENEPPPPDRGQIVKDLTEDLIRANTNVQMAEAQLMQIQNVLHNLDPSTLTALEPYAGIINSVFMPLIQQAYETAKRKRDDIQAELMEYEPSPDEAASA